MDSLLSAADTALRTLFAKPHAVEASPAAPFAEATLDPAQRRLAGALMRVNHVGEVCAQALYVGQAAVARDAATREHLEHAAQEVAGHLTWWQARLAGLDPALEEATFLSRFGSSVVDNHRRDELRACKIMVERAERDP